MDDLCLSFSEASAEGLERRGIALASYLLEYCAKFLVSPNLNPGKTEILLVFRGQGSRALRRKYFGMERGSMLTVPSEYGTHRLHVVGQYTHLGGLIHHSGICKQEAKKRFAQAHHAFTAHRCLVYQNPALPWTKRQELFQMLVMSKLTYGSESWGPLDRQTTHFCRSALVRLYRRLLRVRHDAHMTDNDIVAMSGLPTDEVLLRRSRLRYLATLYACEDKVDWRMILLDTTWCSQICDDLHWMWQRLQHTTKLLAPSEHFRQWDYLLRFHRSYWRKLVNRAVRLSIMKTQDARNLIDFHAQIFDLLQEHGALAYAAPQVSKPRPQGLFGCVACQRSCRNAAGEGAHMFRVHGRINGLRYLFDGTACPACLKEYHTHGHLLAHLRSQTNCQEQLRARQLHCDPAPGIGSTANRRLAAQHNGLIPYQHGHGPLPEVCVPRPPRQEDAAFYDFVCEFILQAPQASLQDLCTRFVEGARGHRISWTSLQATLQAVQANLTAQDFAQCALAESDVLDLLALLGSPEPWPMFQQATRDAVPLDEDLNYFEHWLEQLLNLEDPWQRYAPTVPRLFYQERVFLHAFSGRRRHGDLQWYLEAAFQQRPDVMLTVVSMDLVVDAEWGDISKSTTRAFWLNAAAQGYITGFLAGPPCCTWSQARGRQLTETDRMGPRIIRNKDELWGFLSVSLREQLALTDGNLLLGFSVLILYTLLCGSTDGAGVLEHPAEPKDADLASIWRLPLLRFLQTLPEVELITFAQGLLGADSPKPTALMSLRLPGLMHALHSHRVCRELPRATTIGKDSEGAYRTAALKEYTPAMCRALARAFLQSTPFPEEDAVCASIPTEILDRCKSMYCGEFQTHFGPDHVGG